MGDLTHVVRSYVDALDVTAKFLSGRVIRPNDAERTAAQLFAVLAKHDPPILVGYPDEFKENA